jgi:hypothetical protein
MRIDSGRRALRLFSEAFDLEEKGKNKDETL